MVGLTYLLRLADRFFTLNEFVVCRNLKRNQEKLAGWIKNNPTTERLLKQFDKITLTSVQRSGQIIRHVTPQTDLQARILELLG